MSTEVRGRDAIHVWVRHDFQAGEHAFVDNFVRRKELGAACCVYLEGDKVDDLWGGVRDAATDPVVPGRHHGVGVLSRQRHGGHHHGPGLFPRLARLRRDGLHLLAQVRTEREERITIRQLLAHHAGLFGFDEPVNAEVIADLDRLAGIMARQRPEWEPGTRQAYHTITLGFYEGDLIRRSTPTTGPSARCSRTTSPPRHPPPLRRSPSMPPVQPPTPAAASTSHARTSRSKRYRSGSWGSGNAATRHIALSSAVYPVTVESGGDSDSLTGEQTGLVSPSEAVQHLCDTPVRAIHHSPTRYLRQGPGDQHPRLQPRFRDAPPGPLGRVMLNAPRSALP